MLGDQQTIVEHAAAPPDALEHSEGVDAVLESAALARVRASLLGGPAPRPRTIRIGRYLVISELGRGAMGRVLRAYDPRLHRVVALKVLLAEAMTGTARTRLVTEARAMARLSHPNVVAVYDVHERPGKQVVVAMQLVEGTTLWRWLTAADRGYHDVIEAFVAAGRGLAAAHDAGLLHRDFKPSNVLVSNALDRSASGTVKVTDFGLARDRGEAELAEWSASSGTHERLSAFDCTIGGAGRPRSRAFARSAQDDFSRAERAGGGVVPEQRDLAKWRAAHR